MRFCVLASGSKGNVTLVSDGITRLLVDCGLTCKQVVDRVQSVGVDCHALSGVCITHDHIDHIRGLAVFARRHPGIPLYATSGTCHAVCHADSSLADAPWRIVTPGSDFPVGTLTVHPFATSHDAADSVGYLFRDASGATLGYATDLGYVPAMVQVALCGCQALILESNHDPTLLRNSGRPWSLISRIAGSSGHLSNEQSAELVDAILGKSPLRTLVLAHLSEECNTPDEALDTHRIVLRRHHCQETVRLLAASQDTPTPILEV